MLDRVRKSLMPLAHRRRFQVLLVGEGCLVGIVGGGIVTLYRIALARAEGLMRGILTACGHTPVFVLLWFAALAAIMLVVGKLVELVPNTGGSGIPQTEAEVMGRLNMHWHRIIPTKFVEGVLCTMAGLSLGREGPSVQLGGMSGKAVSRVLKRGRGEERLLVTCGAAAGMSAAFHAPLTGVLFAIEEIHHAFTAPLIISVMASSVVADFFVSQVLGMTPTLNYIFMSTLPHIDYALVVLLGIVMGVLGSLHNAGMFASQGLSKRLGNGYARLAVPFALAGAAAFLAPDLLCGGDAIAELIVNKYGETSLAVLASILVGKYVLTAICFGSGAPGGTLFPLVIMGACAGALYGGIVIGALDMPVAYITNFTLFGIAGLFSAVVRAPVTGIVLVFELSGSFEVLTSVSIVSIIAFVTANLIGTKPFYEKMLGDLLEGQGQTGSEGGLPGEKVLEWFTVGMGSACEGHRIRTIDWPRGVLVVSVTRAGVELMPEANLRLMALDEITVMVNADCEASAMPILVQLTDPDPATELVPGGDDDS